MGTLDDAAVDGNAIGGLLIEVFGTEMTAATGTCGNCGSVSQAAELAGYMPGLGTVVRCRTCGALLITFFLISALPSVHLLAHTPLPHPRPAPASPLRLH